MGEEKPVCTVAHRCGHQVGVRTRKLWWRWGSTQSLQLQDMGTFLCRTIRGLQATAAHDIRLNHFMSNNANSWEVIRNQQKADYNQGLEHPINRQICKFFFFFLAEMLWMAAHLLSKMLPFSQFILLQ